MLADKIIKYIEDNLKDISPDTVRVYKNKFKNLKDKDIIEYFKHAKVRLYVNDDDVTPEKVDNLVKKLNIVKEEHMILPYKNNTKTKYTAIIFPVQIRRLQQLATKESNSSIDASNRNKAGQAANSSKTGKLTDAEVFPLTSVGLDKTLTELLSPRSDNSVAKKSMTEQIRNDLSFSLEKTETSKQSQNTLLYIDAMYKCMNLATDFIDHVEEISY